MVKHISTLGREVWKCSQCIKGDRSKLLSHFGMITKKCNEVADLQARICWSQMDSNWTNLRGQTFKIKQKQKNIHETKYSI